MARQGDVGSRLNEWRPPVYELGPTEHDMTQRIQAATGGINIDEGKWMDSCRAVDKVLSVVIAELRKVASTQYPGLVIQNEVIRQGSSREGLKVRNADEYDCMLPFEILGLHLTHCGVYDRNGKILPGLLKMKVRNDLEIKEKFPWINKLNIIDALGMLDTEKIQKVLFTSILDKSLNEINKRLEDENRRSGYGYRVNRSTNSTNFQLTVQFEGSIRGVHGAFDLAVLESYSRLRSPNISSIDIDFVPGMLIGRDAIPNPYSVNGFHLETMICERYAVMKWVNTKSTNIKEEDRSLLWRNSTAGYEKHILDVARRNPSQRYIMTACRILKAYISREKEWHRDPSDQLIRLVKSYYLKMLCFYCIVFMTVPNNVNRLSGVKEALSYMIIFLEKSLNAGYLPHFFHGNPWLSVILPGCYFEEETEKDNLLCTANEDTIQQARCSIVKLKSGLQGMFLSECHLDQEKIKMFTDMIGKRYE